MPALELGPGNYMIKISQCLSLGFVDSLLWQHKWTWTLILFTFSWKHSDSASKARIIRGMKNKTYRCSNMWKQFKTQKNASKSSGSWLLAPSLLLVTWSVLSQHCSFPTGPTHEFSLSRLGNRTTVLQPFLALPVAGKHTSNLWKDHVELHEGLYLEILIT